MEPYKPTISCDKMSQPPYASCQEAAQRMPATWGYQRFGFAGDSTITVRLPWSVISLDGRCKISVETTSNQVVDAGWNEIWDAATAVNAKCARTQGKGGKFTKLGTPGKLFVQVQDGRGHPALSLPGSTNSTDGAASA